MPIEPCGYPQAHILLLGILVDDAESRPQPARIPERGGLLQHFQGIVHVLAGKTCHPCSQVGSLHCPGSAAANHDKALLGEPLAQSCNRAKHFVGPEQGMPAHDAHTAAVVMRLEEACHRRVDAVVVQGARQQFLDVVGVPPHRHEALVNHAVKACGVTVFILGIETVIEFHGMIERLARHIIGHLGKIGQHVLQFFISC